MAGKIEKSVNGGSLSVRVGLKLPYGHEILTYGENSESRSIEFQTDLAIVEEDAPGSWKPRVILEAKVGRITTHDPITYNHKAASHGGAPRGRGASRFADDRLELIAPRPG